MNIAYIDHAQYAVQCSSNIAHFFGMATNTPGRSGSTINDSLKTALRRKLLNDTEVSSSSIVCQCQTLVQKLYLSLEACVDTVELSPNRLDQVLTISRKIKSYSEAAGHLKL